MSMCSSSHASRQGQRELTVVLSVPASLHLGRASAQEVRRRAQVAAVQPLRRERQRGRVDPRLRTDGLLRAPVRLTRQRGTARLVPHHRRAQVRTNMSRA